MKFMRAEHVTLSNN